MLADRMKRRRPLSSVAASAAVAVALALTGVVAGVAEPSPAADAAPATLTIIVPLVLPAGTTGFADAEALAQYTSPQGLLTRELDAVIDRPVAIGIDPAIIASIRLLGSSAPTSATAWLARLASVSNDTFALAYSDADLTLVTQAGGTLPVGAVALDFAIDPTLFASATDTAQTTPRKPSLPSGTSVLDWPYTVSKLAWPRANTVRGADASALAASGYTAAILASGNVSGEQVPATVEGMRAVVADDDVSTALQTAVSASSDAQWTDAMAALKSAIAAEGRATSIVVATLGRSVPASTDRLAQTLDDLASTSSITPATLSHVLAAAGGATSKLTITDESHDAAEIAGAAQTLASAAADVTFATVAADPGAISGPSHFASLALLSNQWAANPSGRANAIADYLSAGQELRSSIEVLKTSGVNLLADRASLPITVENRLDQAVTVYISVRPETGLLAVGDGSVALQIEPNSQGKGQIPVQAISNGTVRVTVSLTSASGATIGSPVNTSINVQAGWETPIVVVISILVVLLFAGGLVRSIVKRRRAVAERATGD